MQDHRLTTTTFSQFSRSKKERDGGGGTASIRDGAMTTEPNGGDADVLVESGTPVISKVSVNGNLCPAASTVATVTANGSDVEVRSSAPPSGVGSCLVTLGVRPPPGHMFTVERFETLGRVNVEQGASAHIQSSYRMIGRPNEQEAARDLIVDQPGAASLVADFSGVASKAYSACGAHQNIILGIRGFVESGAVAGSGTIQLMNLGNIKFGLRRCTNP